MSKIINKNKFFNKNIFREDVKHRKIYPKKYTATPIVAQIRMMKEY